MTKDLTVNKNIIIKDWAGNILFSGINTDNEVNKILVANRCPQCYGGGSMIIGRSRAGGSIPVDCTNCEASGYIGDFTVEWEDQANQENVYEHINY